MGHCKTQKRLVTRKGTGTRRTNLRLTKYLQDRSGLALRASLCRKAANMAHMLQLRAAMTNLLFCYYWIVPRGVNDCAANLCAGSAGGSDSYQPA